MNNFYASVECMLNMKLKDKPVAVGGDVENRHGIILAKNMPAKRMGVKTAEAIWQAKQKCGMLVVVPPHYDWYMQMSRLCRHIYEQYTDRVEPMGMDSAQVTAGGIVTEEFDCFTMESRLVPGLYACGEILDIDGDCGGYNLQWAWSSGRLAGRSAGKES